MAGILISLALSLLLAGSLFKVLEPLLRTMNEETHRLAQLETLLSVSATVLGELRYSQSVTLLNSQTLRLTKPSGEQITFRLGEGLHKNTLYMAIDKTSMRPPGGTSVNPITENQIAALRFRQLPPTGNTIVMQLSILHPGGGLPLSMPLLCRPLNLP